MVHAFQVGQILLEKYRVERVLGAGGMGVVVAARHLALDERVAIKFMLGGGSQADLARFVREARAASRLKSQHVVRVFDVAALDDGTPYMVLEHLDGADLAHVLRERGPLPVDEAIDAILQASEAIAEAHSIGIIHRDIKPANLFITRSPYGSPCVKVLDFGIAKWANAGTAKMDPSQPMGSAPYMAPEQLAATDLVDARTDVWALGATLFHLLTGKMPFHHEDVDSIHAMMHAVLHREPMHARSLRADLPEALEAVLLRCLAKNRADRFASVAALAAALAPFASDHASSYAKRVAKVLGEPEPMLAAVRSSDAQTAPAPKLVEESARAAAAPRKARLGLALVAPVALLVGVFFIGLWFGREPLTSNAASTPEAMGDASEKPSIASAAPPASSSSAVRISTHEEDTSPSTPSALLPPPRRASVASPAVAPSSASPRPKESLYGRRR